MPLLNCLHGMEEDFTCMHDTLQPAECDKSLAWHSLRPHMHTHDSCMCIVPPLRSLAWQQGSRTLTPPRQSWRQACRCVCGEEGTTHGRAGRGEGAVDVLHVE